MTSRRTSSFILELPLGASAADEQACAVILDAARNIGNAVLGEGLRRLDLMRESRSYRAARRMPRGVPRCAERKARASEFERLFEAFGLTGHALQKFAQACRDNCWIKDHLPGHVAQTATTRAFNAIRQYALGKRRRPKFRRRDRYNSFEGKQAKSLCPSVIQPCKELRRIERAMDRSKHANNPECFDEKGRGTKGARMRVRSKRYQALARKRRERERCLACERKRRHAELANRILGQGTTVKTKKLSYKAWQRQYGKSTKVCAASGFVSILRNKLVAAGGELIEFGTRRTCLSRFCHMGGTYTKKPLSQRYHHFPDGTRVGRDLYSAFLARFVVDNRLDAIQAAKVRKRSCERHRADLNLPLGAADLPPAWCERWMPGCSQVGCRRSQEGSAGGRRTS
jgi:hypothetical protein